MLHTSPLPFLTCAKLLHLQPELSARTETFGEQASGTPSVKRTCTSRWAIKFLGSAPCRRDCSCSFRSSPTDATSPTVAAMVVQTRGTAGTAAGANSESVGSGGAHAASTSTESTQGYKPTSSLVKHFISAMLLVVLFSNIVQCFV